ncbi:protein of unknown function [Paenibacillus sp. UNC496MF]|uniref:DUF4367 domain-containing protein n=1 Tax=Paenibacillus sp. UNC496MF TaxID=1502753 RepID=UPI0008E3DB41|nr:DUF4367 domain-containing protein [Paenibacillus sp. UNC496MF]SFI39999.1 protein of unknown function [Paenibacillus sp. UNC496MF]
MTDRDHTMDADHKLGEQLRQELDETLFASLDFSERAKGEIRRRAAHEKTGRRRAFPAWRRTGAAAAIAALLLVAAFLFARQPDAPAPGGQPGGAAPGGSGYGSELSQLETKPLGSAEDAKKVFGPGLLVPSALPEGYALADIASTGKKDQPVRDVTFNYATASEDKTITFMVSRAPAAFPADMFSPTKVNGQDGYVFEQPTFVELYWTKDGIQYAVLGPITADAAMKIAESARP